jgi:cyclohexa-1,5-dienecarbonyl-CoA hydratase
MTIRTALEDGIGTLTLCRPPLNILNGEMLAAMREALASLATERELRVLVIAADGKHFSAGADVGEHQPPRYRELIPDFLESVKRIDEFPAPVVAAVRGRCLGGGFELVQAADTIVAAEGASFGQPEITLGVLPPAACALLPDLCGPRLAAELVFTGDAIGAAEALAAGLVGRVVPEDRLEHEAGSLARRMARHSGAALRLAKRALRQGASGPRARALAFAQAIYLDELMRTHDAVEGLQAFVEKRSPQWSHQ